MARIGLSAQVSDLNQILRLRMVAVDDQQVGAMPVFSALFHASRVTSGTVVNPGWPGTAGQSSTDWARWLTATPMPAQYVELSLIHI